MTAGRQPSFFSCAWQTFRACCTNLACAPFFLVAMIFYAAYYCWPYMAQLPLHLSTTIVDEDGSLLSRRLIAALESAPQFAITAVTQNQPQAIANMRSGEATAMITIPANFERDVLTDTPTALAIITNGSFIVQARTDMLGAQPLLKGIAEAALAAHLFEAGVGPGRLVEKAMRSPPLVTQTMYNTLSGYLNFAVPIVFVIVFQTLIICGTGMLLNDWFSHPSPPAPLRLALHQPAYLFAMQLPLFGICLFWTLAIEGAAFALQGINSFQNVGATFLVCAFFSFAVTSAGLALGLAFGRSRYLLHTVVTSAIPSVFISGNLFPWQNIPAPLRALADLLPTTPGSAAMMRASQAGATPDEVYPYLVHLLLLGLAWLVAACLLARWRGSRERCVN